MPGNLDGRTLYMMDFSYSKKIMSQLASKAAKFVVLDHHLGAKDAVVSMPEHVFDENRSGATIAWSYFHPNTPIPLMLQYIEDGDLYRFNLPDARAILICLSTKPFNFESWNAFAEQIADETTRAHIVEKGSVYREYFSILIEQMAKKALLVNFEGMECLLVSAPGGFKSDVGHLLSELKPPLGIVVGLRGDIVNVSLRSDFSIDVAAIARKYGGNGHPQAAGFKINWGDPLPWTVVEEYENSSD